MSLLGWLDVVLDWLYDTLGEPLVGELHTLLIKVLIGLAIELLQRFWSAIGELLHQSWSAIQVWRKKPRKKPEVELTRSRTTAAKSRRITKVGLVPFLLLSAHSLMGGEPLKIGVRARLISRQTGAVITLPVPLRLFLCTESLVDPTPPFTLCRSITPETPACLAGATIIVVDGIALFSGGRDGFHFLPIDVELQSLLSSPTFWIDVRESPAWFLSDPMLIAAIKPPSALVSKTGRKPKIEKQSRIERRGVSRNSSSAKAGNRGKCIPTRVIKAWTCQCGGRSSRKRVVT